MGITWKAMPLLSTLAALVIIVNSAEEDMDRALSQDYRHELRTRLVDSESPNYDEPWRAIDTEPMMQKSTHGDKWEDSSERPLRRRKPARKRKRRPITSPEEEKPEHISTEENHRSEVIKIDSPGFIHLYPIASEIERYSGPDETLRYRDTQYNPELTTEKTRRRRKKPDTRRNRWNEDYTDAERPMRRRGHRRKRPSVDENLPILSEFNDFRILEQKSLEENAPIGALNVGSDEFQEINSKHVPTSPDVDVTTEDGMNKNGNLMLAFSMETVNPEQVNRPNNIYENKLKAAEKVAFPATTNMLEKLKEDRPIDPVTLKEILKRSNGTSLSEILQQHNLSLTDLLRGKEAALSIVKPEETSDIDENRKNKSEEISLNINENEHTEEQVPKEVILVTEAISENDSIQVPGKNTYNGHDLESQSTGTETRQQNSETDTNESKTSAKRGPTGVRRRLRMRPYLNGTHKSQLNRDLMAQTARKYQNTRNITKSKEWKYIIPMMNGSYSSEEDDVSLTTTSVPEETTIFHTSEYRNPTTNAATTQLQDRENEGDNSQKETTTTITTTQETTTLEMTTTTAKPIVSRLRPTANRMGLRRQAFNNRLKRKRMKQKNSTTEPPVQRDEYGIDLFGMPNLVSSSEFIARTQTPKPTFADEEDFTTLDDFMTTEKSKHAENGPRFTRNSSVTHEETVPTVKAITRNFISTTEETAKFEIEEILNDTRTSARLSRILMERNMTLNELVEHRERGSSHVHLADIFHNASKEPNPPEPFLSKSSIEPISRETYPLRAILEANLHDSTAKATTIDPSLGPTYPANIPVVMDFGNNVNENSENMGIISLFNKITGTDIDHVEKTTIGKDSEGTPYVTTVILVNNTGVNETTARESRVLKKEENNLKHDVVAWSELFELMRKSQQNESDELITLNNDDESRQQILLQDSDGDGLIILEDLQRLKDYDRASEEKLDINSYEADTSVPNILDKPPSHTRSVTVATASIVGLAMILFLLTYAAFKWKQQRNLLRKKQNFPDDRIPSPVFENRKGHKNNSSNRSISPMLATSNIYTLNTLDSNGKESPDYMWDSLRKPFQ